MSAQRLFSTGFVAFAALAFTAAPADAGVGYKFGGSFGSFSSPLGVAVDNSASVSSGDVYVANIGGNVVEQFSASGGALATLKLAEGAEPFGAAISPVSGDVYVAELGNGGRIEEFEPTGKSVALAAGSFGPGLGATSYGSVTGDAVDPTSGEVYVADYSNNLVDVFSPAGTYITQFGSGQLNGPEQLALDAAGDIYIVNANAGQVVELTPSSTPVSASTTWSAPVAVTEGGASGVAVDTKTGNVFVADGPQVNVYGPSTPGPVPGSLITTFAAGHLASSFGIGVENATGTAYVADSASNNADIFEEGPTPEKPETINSATEITGVSAKLHGELNPGGAKGELKYQFDYAAGGTCNGAGVLSTPLETVAEAEKHAVEAEATGLSPKTQYTFCLDAENEFGSTLGNEVSVETTAAKPVIEAESSPEVTISTAKVEATINPSGAETTCEVEYGLKPLTEEAGTVVGCPAALGEGHAGVSVTVVLAGLGEGTVYHYRVIANNAFSSPGGTPGPEQTLQTLIKPTIVEQSASVISAQAVLLSAVVNTYDTDTTYHFVYGPGEGYGSSAPASDIDLGASNENLKAQVELSGLTPGTTYHYALVAHDVGGTRIGPDQTFTTPSALLPVVVTGAAGEVFQNGAGVSGMVDPQGRQTFYEFDLGTDTSYGARVFGNAGFGTGPVAVSVNFQNLAAGTTYHYRLLAINTYGTTYGPDQTFTTPAYPTATLTAPVAPVLIPVPTAVFPVGEPVAAGAKAGSAKKKKQKKPKKGKAGRARRAGRGHANKGRGK